MSISLSAIKQISEVPYDHGLILSDIKQLNCASYQVDYPTMARHPMGPGHTGGSSQTLNQSPIIILFIDQHDCQVRVSHDDDDDDAGDDDGDGDDYDGDGADDLYHLFLSTFSSRSCSSADHSRPK